MTRFLRFGILVLAYGFASANWAQADSVAHVGRPIWYSCEIQQMDFVGGRFIKKTYAKGNINLAKSGSLVVDMPRAANDPQMMRVLLDVGASLDKSKTHIGFTAIDKHGSANFSDWVFAFQIQSEFDLGARFISLQSANSAYMVEFSCKLLTI